MLKMLIYARYTLPLEFRLYKIGRRSNDPHFAWTPESQKNSGSNHKQKNSFNPSSTAILPSISGIASRHSSAMKGAMSGAPAASTAENIIHYILTNFYHNYFIINKNII